jgi:hypothetical protein
MRLWTESPRTTHGESTPDGPLAIGRWIKGQDLKLVNRYFLSNLEHSSQNGRMGGFSLNPAGKKQRARGAPWPMTKEGSTSLHSAPKAIMFLPT